MVGRTYRGYTLSLELVKSGHSPGRTHLRAQVTDLLWLMRLPEAERVTYPGSVFANLTSPGSVDTLRYAADLADFERRQAEEYDIGPRYRAPMTNCGIGEPLSPAVPSDEDCGVCYGDVNVQLDIGVDILSSRWRHRWPDYPRSLALTEWRD